MIVGISIYVIIYALFIFVVGVAMAEGEDDEK